MTISVVVSPTPPDAVVQGPDGKSAYQVAVDNGFVGTQAEWLASLGTFSVMTAHVDHTDGRLYMETVALGRETPVFAIDNNGNLGVTL